MSAPIAVVVSVSPAVRASLPADSDAIDDQLRSGVGVQLRVLLGPDAFPTPPSVELRVADGAQPAPVQVRIGEHDCDIAPQAFWDALGDARGRAETAPRATGTGDAEPSEVAEAVIEFVRVAVAAHAARFVPDDAPRAAALDLGVALPSSGASNGRTVDDLLDEFVAPAIDVVVEPGYLRFLAQDRDGGLFPFLREGLLIERGLKFPEFVLRTDARLRARAFYFVVNGTATTPRIGPPEGTLLVNDTPERLSAAGFTGTATSNPATAQPAAFVAGVERATLDTLGYTTWNSPDYLILAFAATLRTVAPGLVTHSTVADMLTDLEVTDPELVNAARQVLPVTALAGVVRSLLGDGVSVRNVRLIVENLLRHRKLSTAQDPPARIAAVRAALRDAIAATLSRGSATIVAYLLGPELERAVTGAQPLPADTARAIVAAVAAEVAVLPPTAMTPAILTHETVRPPLAALLRRPFPQIRVVSYNDLPASVNVQPVARISLTV